MRLECVRVFFSTIIVFCSLRDKGWSKYDIRTWKWLKTSDNVQISPAMCLEKQTVGQARHRICLFLPQKYMALPSTTFTANIIHTTYNSTHTMVCVIWCEYLRHKTCCTVCISCNVINSNLFSTASAKSKNKPVAWGIHTDSEIWQ